MSLSTKLIKKTDRPGHRSDDEEEYTEEFTFFQATEKKGGGFSVKIIYDKNYAVLRDKLKFFCHKLPDKTLELLKVDANVAERVTREDIITDYRKWIKSLPEYVGYVSREQILQVVDERTQSLFSSDALSQIWHPLGLNFNEDTSHRAYVYYENGYVQITAQEKIFRPYATLPRIIYKDEILPRDYIADVDFKNGQYYQFVNNIAGNGRHTDESGQVVTGKYPERFKAFCSFIGYLLHRYNQGKKKAIILTDGRMTEDSDGRSGKGLLAKGIKNMMNIDEHSTVYVEVNGKNFKSTDERKYANAETNTKLVHLDDAQKNLVIDDLFVDIDSKMAIRKMQRDAFFIFAKLLISTNQTIRLPSGSARDRVVEYELADYYSDDFEPYDEFKAWFFRDWNEEEWARFDNFMTHCIQIYLRNGIIRCEPIMLNKRKLVEETCSEWVEFMTEFYKGEIDLAEADADLPETRFAFNVRLDKKLIEAAFLRRYEDWQKLAADKNTRFNKKILTWIRTWCMYHEDFHKPFKKKEKNESKSGMKYFWTFYPSDLKKAQMTAAEKGKEQKESK